MDVDNTGKIEDVSKVTTSELAIAFNSMIDRLNKQDADNELIKTGIARLLRESGEGRVEMKAGFDHASEDRTDSHNKIIEGIVHIKNTAGATNENTIIIGKSLEKSIADNDAMKKEILSKINVLYGELQNQYAGRN